MFFFTPFFDTYIVSIIFTAKNTNADGILFLDFVNVFNIDWKFHIFKFKLFSKILSALAMIAG